MGLTTMLASAGDPTPVTEVDVIGTVVDRSDDFLGLVTKIGDTCVNNEICLSFLTVTFMSLGVRLLRKIISAFGRGR